MSGRVWSWGRITKPRRNHSHAQRYKPPNHNFVRTLSDVRKDLRLGFAVISCLFRSQPRSKGGVAGMAGELIDMRRNMKIRRSLLLVLPFVTVVAVQVLTVAQVEPHAGYWKT